MKHIQFACGSRLPIYNLNFTISFLSILIPWHRKRIVVGTSENKFPNLIQLELIPFSFYFWAYCTYRILSYRTPDCIYVCTLVRAPVLILLFMISINHRFRFFYVISLNPPRSLRLCDTWRNDANETHRDCLFDADLSKRNVSCICMHALTGEEHLNDLLRAKRYTHDSFMLLTTYSRGVHWYVSTVLRAVAPDRTRMTHKCYRPFRDVDPSVHDFPVGSRL